MATIQTQCTKGCPITVIYPAEKLSDHRASVRFRVGKKTALPAYTNSNLPYLVQFQKGQRVIMFMLSDVLQASYWQRIRNAYNVFGQLDIDADVKMSAADAKRIRRWLAHQSAARGIALDPTHASVRGHDLVSEAG